MSGLTLRLGLVMLLLCRCTLDPQNIAPDGGVVRDGAFDDVGDTSKGKADAGTLADMSAPAARRIVERRWAVEDGTEIGAFTYYDTKLKIECSFLPDENKVVRCLPSEVESNIFNVYYLDNMCTKPIAVQQLKSCSIVAKGHYVREIVQQVACPSDITERRWRTHIIGSEIFSSGPLYQGSATSTCFAFAPLSGSRYFSLSATPSTDFATAVLK